MSHGLEILNAAGAKRLGAGDFVHRLYQKGSVTFNPFFDYGYVSVPGLTVSDAWFVVAYGDAIVTLQPNQLRFQGLDAGLITVYYSLYRR